MLLRFASELKLVRAWPDDDIHLYMVTSTGDYYAVATHGVYKVFYDASTDPPEIDLYVAGYEDRVPPGSMGMPLVVEEEITTIVGNHGWHGGEPPEYDA